MSVTWPVRVYVEDTDFGGVVYYANYLRWLERARTEWLRSKGLSQAALARDSGILFSVVSVQVNYRRPARLDDELIIKAEGVTPSNDALQFSRDSIWGHNVNFDATWFYPAGKG